MGEQRSSGSGRCTRLLSRLTRGENNTELLPDLSTRERTPTGALWWVPFPPIFSVPAYGRAVDLDGQDAILVRMKLAHTMIRVSDLDATLDFYTGFLGLREVRRSSIGDEATLVFLADEEESYFIELTYNHDGREYEPGNQFGHLALTVADLDSVISEVERRGWWFRESKPTSSSRYIFVKDPNGYDIEILQAK